MLRSLRTSILIVALAAAGCGGEKAPALPKETAHDWQEAFRAAGRKGLGDVVDVRREYLASTTAEQRVQYVAETGVSSLGSQENQWIIAESLHTLGKYEEASAMYTALLEAPSPLYARTRLTFRKALADTEIPMREDIAVDDMDKKAELLDRLMHAEDTLARDEWSHKLEYRIVFLQYLLGSGDVNRLARMAQAIDATWSSEGEDNKLVHGSTLYMAEETLRAAGRVQEADAIAVKLIRFDELYGTNYGSGDHGGH